MKYHHAIWVFIFLLASCDSKAGSTPGALAPTPSASTANVITAGPISYSMKTVKQKISDSAAPLGRWKINKTYPVIVMAKNQALMSALNQKIDEMVNQYGCKNKGDEGFNAEIMLVNDKLFSMRYESSWMCGAMPHPDSTQGALNYDLEKNSAITLTDQFTDAKAQQAFTAMVLQKLNQAITDRSRKNQMTCPPATQLGRFYVTAEALVISSPSVDHADAGCDVEISIPRQDANKFINAASVLY